MKSFQSILCVSTGSSDENEAFRQALSLARDNGAAVTVLVAVPALPNRFGDYRKVYEESLVTQANQQLAAAREALGLAAGVPAVRVEMECGETPAVRIIRRVLREESDLVVKTAEPAEGGKGFRALDMTLLRKCPCAVWLCRTPETGSVAVAIDPVSEAPEGRDLAGRLLELSHSLARSRGAKLKIISCWSYPFEGYLHDRVAADALSSAIRTEQTAHRAALDLLIADAGVAAEVEVHHVQGIPEAVVPGFVEREDVGVLVMGSVARTGLAGFFIGNTAENIFQRIGCSLLALKPGGFVSPIKAY